MAYDVTEDLDAFRAEVRDWLEANCPPSMRTPMKDDEIVWGGRKGEFVNPDSKIWLERMGAAGRIAPDKGAPCALFIRPVDVRPGPARIRQ